jgi:hypothetical protein
MQDYIERYEDWVWNDDFAVIDTMNDNQVVKIYKTHRACCNNVVKLNHEYNNV